MNLQGYFDRIGYRGTAEPTTANLRAIHRAHALSIAYENLDVLLQRPVTQDIEAIYEKIVVQGRGGWCYEMNGLLCWALRETGFDVTRMTGGVMRAEFGDAAFGNHLVLRVDLDEPWIADVGIGDCFVEPLPLVAGEHRQGLRSFTLEQLNDTEWRLHNREGGMPPSFDFRNAPADENLLAETCERLQADPQSKFRENLICQRMAAQGGWSQLGISRLDLASGERTVFASEDEFLGSLHELIGALPPDAHRLWPSALARHKELFPDDGS